MTLNKSGRLFVHDRAIRVRRLPKKIVDVLIIGECWRDHEKKTDKRLFHLNSPSMYHAGRSKRRATPRKVTFADAINTTSILHVSGRIRSHPLPGGRYWD